MPIDRPTRRSRRLSGFDYRSAASYFITICTHNRSSLFGRVTDQVFVPSAEGMVADEEWRHTCQLREILVPDVHCVMPNHVHLLFSINWSDDVVFDASDIGQLRLLADSVSAIVGGYKAAVTRRIRRDLNRPDLEVWQERFHDHVVKTPQSFDQIAEYIVNNPLVWEQDRYNADL